MLLLSDTDLIMPSITGTSLHRDFEAGNLQQLNRANGSLSQFRALC